MSNEEELTIIGTEAKRINEIEEVKELDDPDLIKRLKITQSDKLISMNGLEMFANLVHLDLSCNKLVSLSSMNNLNDLKDLDLSCNNIVNLDGIGNLINVERINLAHNKISNIKGLQNLSYSATNLKMIDLKDNLIDSPNQFIYLQKLNLETLVFQEGCYTNPVCSHPNYIKFIREILPSLLILDDQPVSNYDTGSIQIKRNSATMVKTRAKKNKPSSSNQNFQTEKFSAFQMNNEKPPFTENKDIYDIKYKFFKDEASMLLKQMGNIQNNPVFTKERIRALENNIEGLFRDQKELVARYENNDKYWSNKLEDTLNSNKELKEKARILSNRLEDAQSELKEALDRVSLRDHEISSLKRALDDKESTVLEQSNKVKLLRNDLEFSRGEYERINKKYNDISRENEELKREKNALKEQISKSDGFYKEIYNKKQEEEMEKLTIIKNLENKIFELSKSVSEKQSQMEKLLEKNTILSTQLKNITREVEHELIPLKEKEKEELIKKHKAELVELESNFKKVLQDKNDEFLNDLEGLQKEYKKIIEETNSKYTDAKKEQDRLSKALSDCKELLRDSEINYENSINKIKSMEKELEGYKSDKERNLKISEENTDQLKQKIKIFELEVRDQNENILKNENLIKSLKKALSAKDDECNLMFEESSKLKNSISQLNVQIEKLEKEIIKLNEEKRGLLTKINTDSNLIKIDELEETIKTKNHMLNDQNNQIQELKKKIEEYESVISDFDQEKERIRKKYDKKMKEQKMEKEKIIEEMELKDKIINELQELVEVIRSELSNYDEENKRLTEEISKKEEVFNL